MRVAKYMASNIAAIKYSQNQRLRFISRIIAYFILNVKATTQKIYIARSKYPRRNMHFRYEPTDLDVVFRGTDNNARWPTSLYSFD